MASKTERLARSVAVIGLGRFGRSLALELMADGVEVLGIDKEDRLVQYMSGRLTHVAQADSTDEEALQQLTVPDFTRVVVGVGSDLEASILTTSILVDFGVPHIWAKAVSHSHAKILRKVGAHEVVRPEHDMGKRVAHVVRSGLLDYIEFDDGYVMAKIRTPTSLCGTPLQEQRLRVKHGVTVVATKAVGGEFTYATPETVVARGDLVIVAGSKATVERFAAQK